jgi:RNA polymerase sigma-70 factor, ECF subfamily
VNVALRVDVNPGEAAGDNQPSPAAPDAPLTWRRLYDQHLPLVYRIVRRMGVPEGDCADVCQEVFLRAYRGLAGFRGEAQVGTWLCRITFNEVARHGRSATLRRGLGALLGRQSAPPPAAQPDDLLVRNQGARELERVLAGMRPKQRQVFVLFELEELSLAQIAEVLGCSLETVRSRLRHARADFERLRRQGQMRGRQP